MLTIFEKGVKGKYYLKLSIEFEADDDINLSAFSISSVTVIETIMGSTPYLNIKFIDAIGELISLYPLIPDVEFVIKYGKSKEESQESKFKLSTINYSPLSNADMESILVTSDMIHNKWEEMFKKTLSRSWKDKKYSEVIQEVVKDMEFDDIDIEETSKTFDIIQPNWTNSTFLKWLTSNSVNKQNIGGFVYFITLDNRFVFSSMDNLYNNKPKKTINHSLSTSGVKDNTGGYNFINIKNNYMPVLNQGGFGQEHMHFDYNNKEFVKDKKVITDIKERQLSDWYYIAESHVEPSKLVYGGRDTNIKDVVDNNILNSANSVQNVDMYINGDIDLHIGDLVNIRIPVSKKLKESSVINDTYSGHWLIWKVGHIFDIDSNNFITQLFLTRNGINGKDLTGLVKTSIGKKVI